MDDQSIKVINKRIDGNKKNLIDELRRTPIVGVACKKVGVSRATYYRWRAESEIFCQQTDRAIKNGVDNINDFAESKLIRLMDDNNPGAIFYWLNHRHPDYSPKIFMTTEESQKMIEILSNSSNEKTIYDVIFPKVFENKLPVIFIRFINTFLHNKMIGERLKIEAKKHDLMLSALSYKKSK